MVMPVSPSSKQIHKFNKILFLYHLLTILDKYDIYINWGMS